MRRVWLLLVGSALASALSSDPAVGQDPGPFETLSFSTGPASNFNKSRLHESWSAKTGGVVRVSTPFHVGYLAAGLRYVRYTPTASVPGFDGAFYYAAWGFQKTVSRATARLGLRAGNLRMAFDDADETPGLRNESEFTWGVEARINIRLTNAWSVYGGGSVERTMTRLPMELRYLSVGIDYRMRTPGWLRRFLL